MSDWKSKIGGGFAYQTASFAVHPKDEERAFELLELLRSENVGWEEAEKEFNRYLNSKTSNQEWINEQLQRVRIFFTSRLTD